MAMMTIDPRPYLHLRLHHRHLQQPANEQR